MSVPSQQPAPTSLWTIAGAFFLAAICAAILFMYSAPGESNPSPTHAQDESITPVTSSLVEYQQIAQKVYASGKLTHKGKQALAFKVSGTLDSVNVEEGQYVKKGEVLAALDMEEINAELTKARSVYTQSQRDLQRLQSLFDKKVIPLNQVEEARTAMEVAEANLDLAIEHKRQAVLVAPQDGIILAREIEEKELVRPHQTAFMLSDTSKGWIIRTQVSDKDMIRLSRKDQARILFDAYPGKSFTGQVSEIAASANAATLLFEVEVRVDPEQTRLLEGFIGHIEIVPEMTQRIAYVPVESVVAANQNRIQLFQIREDKTVSLEEASMAWLETGKIAIHEGLEDGALIVSKGATFLHEGSKIQVADAQP